MQMTATVCWGEHWDLDKLYVCVWSFAYICNVIIAIMFLFAGGKVIVSQKGVSWVVWERRREDSNNGGEKVDLIPFLSVSHVLGDFWSYCPSSGKFVVSPTPDVHMHLINPVVMKFVVLASDGFWNVMSPKEMVNFIWDYKEARDKKLHQTHDVVKAIINEALNRWKKQLWQTFLWW